MGIILSLILLVVSPDIFIPYYELLHSERINGVLFPVNYFSSGLDK